MLTHHNILTQWNEHKAMEVLVYYDMPLLYCSLFSDTMDCPHRVLIICNDIEGLGESKVVETWLALRISTARYQAAVEGKLPLRDVFTTPEDHVVFRVTLINGHASKVQTLTADQLTDDMLPDPGVLLTD